eukprot:CAMPEP_0113700860 /NCGR_PEP_ID=MMETSP0038_2-20120614/24221_1 /TAXON_ID=2898 /ORGANISM="Cryptomonas paramecium" /LENGTH=44 /DNA_ID=CAMNT_0000624623 /DNA_START=260 /DNA_END=391 /DNA_ORIENTATION=+ /assembly_acc=CAM_ASM_000170
MSLKLPAIDFDDSAISWKLCFIAASFSGLKKLTSHGGNVKDGND